MMLIIAGAFCLSCVVCFLVYAIDKQAAVTGRRRISEQKLLFYSLLGPGGALIAVYSLRHKSQKRAFQLKLALVVAIGLTAWASITAQVQ